MLPFPPVAPQRLLALPDAHGALLAEFDYFPAHETLWVRWHGHLTPAAMVEATSVAIGLRPDGTAPRRLLSDQSLASGDWTEAMPWIQYEWLPGARRHGLRAMAFVVSADPVGTPSYSTFLADAQHQMPAAIFRDVPSAWHWLQQQAPHP